MLAIARRAGVVEATLYRFFKTKQDLMLRVAEDWLEEQLSVESGFASIRGTWNRLRHLIWRALQAMHNDPELSRFVIIEMRPTATYRTTRLFRLNRRFTAQVRTVCDEAIEAGEFRSDVSSSLLRDMIFGCIEHQTWSLLRREGDVPIDAVADNIANVIYRGMAVGTPPAGDQIGNVLKRLEAVTTALETSLASRIPDTVETAC